VRHWAEVPYVPSDGVATKDRPDPPRYLTIRITEEQDEPSADGGVAKHFAVVTNLPDPPGGRGVDLIRWQRAKAGMVEHSHHVQTNELAAAALPSQRFGANAAWSASTCCSKRVALPEELHDARLKRLRFVLLNGVGKVVRHARETVLRLVGRRAASSPTMPVSRSVAGRPRHRRLTGLTLRAPPSTPRGPARARPVPTAFRSHPRSR